MKNYKYPLTISTLVVFSFVTLENSLADNELFDHPLFAHQAKKNAYRTVSARNQIKDLEETTQPGWVKWAAAQIFGEGEAIPIEQSNGIQSHHSEIKADVVQPGEGWGSWLYQSIDSSISYAGQVMNTMIQAVLGSNYEDEQDTLGGVMPPSLNSLGDVIVEPISNSTEPSFSLSAPPDLPKFDTITYVEGMQEVLLQGIENADPLVVGALQKKDEEVRARFDGLPESYSEALRKAQWLRALDGNYQEVAAVRRKGPLKRRIMNGSIFLNPVVVRAN
jgi:hypothetical protein